MAADKIEFELLGLHLQEPVALVTNWLMCAFSIYAFFQLTDTSKKEVYYWKLFFLFFIVATFFGGTGHLFFKYFGLYGKFPNWIATIVSGYFAGKAMTLNITDKKNQRNYDWFLVIKSMSLLVSALVTLKFLYIAVDAILTYIIYCGVLGWGFYKKGHKEMKYFTFGVIICLPSVFIFFLDINLHKWFNKDDLCHLFLLACIYQFYIGSKSLMKNKVQPHSLQFMKP